MSGSKRPDGTFRKPIAVRPGFVTEELDAAAKAYESKGAKVKKEAAAYIPGYGIVEPPSKAKPKKQKEALVAPKPAAAAASDDVPVDKMAAVKINSEASAALAAGAVAAEDQDPVKKMRKLKKVIREIEVLEKARADGAVLEPSQVEKLSKKSSILEELAQLESSRP